MAEYRDADADTTTEEAVKEAVRKARAEAAEESSATEIPIEDGDEEAASQTKARADGAKKSEAKAEDGRSDAEDNKEADSAGDTQASGDQGGKDKKFFKKKPDPRDEKIAELTDRVQRQMAEFDNFRKRTEREKASSFESGEASALEKILPIVDNFERGLAAVPEEQKSDPFVEGMDKVYKQLVKILTEMGVEPIEAVGKEFDPNLHNAVMHVDDDQYGENIVCEEFQKGYKFHDTVIRHSMVKVAN